MDKHFRSKMKNVLQVILIICIVNFKFLNAQPSVDEQRILMQAFYWDCFNESGHGNWWDYISPKMSEISNAGITEVWLPVSWKANHNPSMGYDPYDYYDLGEFEQKFGDPATETKEKAETYFGSRTELEGLIGDMHSNGLKAYADVVFNHCAGGASETNPNTGGNTDTDFQPLSGQYTFNYNDFHPSSYETSDPGVFGDYPDVCHANPHVMTVLEDYQDWLINTIGYDGFRYDWGNGMHPWVIEQLQDANGKFGVTEYWEQNKTNVETYLSDINYSSTVFDFPLFYHLRDMCNNESGFYDMSDLSNAGIQSSYPANAVTFVQNHDTDKEVDYQIALEQKMLAYAFILTNEGIPTVFWRDYYNYGLAKTGKATGIDQLMWVRKNLATGSTTQLYTSEDLYVMQRDGDPGLVLGMNDSYTQTLSTVVQTQWPNTVLKPYAWGSSESNVVPESIETDENGWINITVLPRGYVVYAPDDGTYEPQRSTQSNTRIQPMEPWQTVNVGVLNPSGVTTYFNNKFSINSAGTDIYNTADNFHYVYQPVNGNVNFIAKLESFTSSSAMNGWAKTGLMMREGTDVGAANVFLGVTAANGITFQYRNESNNETVTLVTESGVEAPVWLRLERIGNNFSGYYSTDGANWSQVGNSVSASFSSSLYVGLPVSSHSTNVVDAVFSDVNLSSDAVSVSDLNITPASITIEGGEEVKLLSTVLPSNAANKNITWSSNDEAIATISGDGVVKGIGTGEAIITISSEDGGLTSSCTVNVSSSYVPVTSISLSPENITICPTCEEKIAHVVSPTGATITAVDWVSSDESVAVVTEDGFVKGVSTGQATITAISCDNALITASVIVTVSAGTPQAEMYVAGSMNGWLLTSMNSTDGGYNWSLSNVAFSAGDHEVKFANKGDWSGDDWGISTGLSGVAQPSTGGGANLSFTITEADNYDVHFNSSTLAYSFYVPKDQVATPEFSPTGGTFLGSQNISLSCTTPGSLIYYTVDGSEPTIASTLYTGTVIVTETTTLSAIAVAAGMDNSNVRTESYIITPNLTATPVFSVNGGIYTRTQNVSISCATEGASIYYTTDNTKASSSSVLYTGAITLTKNTTVRAIAVKEGYSQSNEIKADYQITGNTNIAKRTNDYEVQVYPNPATTAVAIDFGTSSAENYEIRIYNKVGQLMKAVQTENVNTYTMDISDLSMGIYFVQLKAKETSCLKKLIVNRYN